METHAWIISNCIQEDQKRPKSKTIDEVFNQYSNIMSLSYQFPFLPFWPANHVLSQISLFSLLTSTQSLCWTHHSEGFQGCPYLGRRRGGVCSIELPHISKYTVSTAGGYTHLCWTGHTTWVPGMQGNAAEGCSLLRCHFVTAGAVLTFTRKMISFTSLSCWNVWI